MTGDALKTPLNWNATTRNAFAMTRAVIKSRGTGIFPGYYECGPGLLLLENRRKLEPKETPRCLIPRLLVVFAQQLEILATTLYDTSKSPTLVKTHFHKVRMINQSQVKQ